VLSGMCEMGTKRASNERNQVFGGRREGRGRAHSCRRRWRRSLVHSMRVSVPTITVSVSRHAPLISPQSVIDRIAAFLAPGNVAVLTGAGVSVDSGIRAYRGKDGRYVNPNYKCVRRAARIELSTNRL
jgi:hypothetical protein